jgi:methanethiol S-methyltransferase
MAILLYAVFSYVVFFATILYAVGFVGGFVVPKSIDGAAAMATGPALAIDLALLAVFALQHSVMARPAFKRAWTKIVPEAAERATYTLFASLALLLLFWLWQPLGGSVWVVHSPPARALLLAGFAFGWALVLVTTFLLNHFELFGLRQAWLHFKGRPHTALTFATPGPYRLVRHPLYVGFLFAFWCTPVMTATHLVFAVMTTAYILIAIRLEERDLVAALPEYDAYRRRVRMLLPLPRAAARRLDTQ